MRATTGPRASDPRRARRDPRREREEGRVIRRTVAFAYDVDAFSSLPPRVSVDACAVVEPSNVFSPREENPARCARVGTSLASPRASASVACPTSIVSRASSTFTNAPSDAICAAAVAQFEVSSGPPGAAAEKSKRKSAALSDVCLECVSSGSGRATSVITARERAAVVGWWGGRRPRGACERLVSRSVPVVRGACVCARCVTARVGLRGGACVSSGKNYDTCQLETLWPNSLSIIIVR